MNINLRYIELALAAEQLLPPVRLLNKLRDRQTRVSLTHGEVAIYLHLDDGSVMSRDVSVAERLRDLIVHWIRRAGFGVTIGDPMETGRYIGLTPTSSPAPLVPT